MLSLKVKNEFSENVSHECVTRYFNTKNLLRQQPSISLHVIRNRLKQDSIFNQIDFMKAVDPQLEINSSHVLAFHSGCFLEADNQHRLQLHASPSMSQLHWKRLAFLTGKYPQLVKSGPISRMFPWKSSPTRQNLMSTAS